MDLQVAILEPPGQGEVVVDQVEQVVQVDQVELVKVLAEVM